VYTTSITGVGTLVGDSLVDKSPTGSVEGFGILSGSGTLLPLMIEIFYENLDITNNLFIFAELADTEFYESLKISKEFYVESRLLT
jgi:hypothetical protein